MPSDSPSATPEPAERNEPPAEAKPSAPGPEEPKSIAASILPQRIEDAQRHPDVPQDERAEGLNVLDHLAAAAEQAVETTPPAQDESQP